MLGWFRRHATILMVFLGSAAMVIFGLGQVFDSFARSASEKVYENPTVATWEGGELTRNGLMRVYQSHAESVRFLDAVVDAAETKAGDRIVPLADRISLIQANNQEQIVEAVLARMVLAKAAENQGFVVSDRMVEEYIAAVSGDAQFSSADLDRINRNVNQTSLDVVKQHLGLELLAMQMGSLSTVGMNLQPNPTEAISLFGRTTAERIECEVIPIVVDDFVSKVTATPSDSELRELYKKGKNDLPDPLGKDPGFKLDRKINVQYFVADADTFLKNEMSKITDEEVQKEYDRLVAANDVMVVEPVVIDNSFAIPGLNELPSMPGGDADSNPDDAPAPPSDAPAPPSDAPAPPSDDAPTTSKPAMESKPATEMTPSVEVPATPAVPSVEVPATPVIPNIEVPSAPAVVPESSSHTVRQTRAQFVSLQQPTEVAPATIQETAGQAIDETTQAVDQPAEEAVAQPTATTDQPSTTVELPQADLPPASEPQAGGIGSDIEEELERQESAPERKYKPLTDVADEIRRALALPKANIKMSLAIETVEFELQDYYNDLEDWKSEDTNDLSEKPALPDYEAIAKQYNLRLKQTGLVDRDAMKTDPFGSTPFDNTTTTSEYLFFFAGDRKLYDTGRYGGASQLIPDYYLFWTTENEKPRVADFSDCKEQIVDFWKKQQALELAKEEAKSISNAVNDNRRSKLTELYPDQALPTGQFSWLVPTRRQGSVLGKPGNVEFPSDEFMQTAFSLVELEAGIAVDSRRETVYVIQATKGSKPVEELGADYLQNQFMKFKQVSPGVNGAAFYYSRREQVKYHRELRDELGLEYDPNFSE